MSVTTHADLEGSSCHDYPTIFASALLEAFDEEDFRESQNPDLPEGEVEWMLREARSQHQEFQPRAIQAAKSVCATCPVLDACRTNLAMSIPPDDIYGVVGGLTKNERVQAQRSAKRAKARALREQKTIDLGTPVAVGRNDMLRVKSLLAPANG